MRDFKELIRKVFLSETRDEVDIVAQLVMSICFLVLAMIAAFILAKFTGMLIWFTVAIVWAFLVLSVFGLLFAVIAVTGER